MPLTRKVAVQEPIRSPTMFFNDEATSDEYDIDTMGTRTNNNMPISTAIQLSHSSPDIMREISKMEPVSPLQRKSFRHKKLTGSISLQDLNIYSPKKAKTRYGMIILLCQTRRLFTKLKCL